MKKSFFILVLLIFGCTPKDTKNIPKDVLKPDQMVRVLIDIHLLESKVRKLYLRNDSSEVVYRHYEAKLFDDLGIPKEKYDRSLEFYVNEIDVLNDIYNEVSDSLLARSKSENFR